MSTVIGCAVTSDLSVSGAVDSDSPLEQAVIANRPAVTSAASHLSVSSFYSANTEQQRG